MATIRSLCRAAPLVAIVLLGLGLRLAPWSQNRFMEDEALYSYWGLQIASGADPMLDNEPVDKPPLHPYILALSFTLLVPSLRDGQTAWSLDQVQLTETAARLPSLLASASSIVLVYALTKAIWPAPPAGARTKEPPSSEPAAFRELGALLAALLLALSPFDVLFASTAFTDPLMAALVMAALLSAARNRLLLAGLLAGLAAAAKQQGLFFLPLIVIIGLLSTRGAAVAIEPTPSQETLTASPLAAAWSAVRLFLRHVWRQRWVRFSLGFLVVAGGALLWDAARLQRPGFLEQSLVSYGGLGPARPQDLAARGLDWLGLVGSFWVSPWFNGLLLTATGASIVLALARRPQPGLTRLDLTVALFVLAFLCLHWLVGFQTWDRYLLALVPLLSVLAARALMSLSSAIRSERWRWIFTAGLAAFLIAPLPGPVARAATSELPLGGDHGAYDGIDELAAYLRAGAPDGSVLYHTWLGYHYRLYLYGAPLRTHWYPDLQDLVSDARIYRREPRYIAFPSWRDEVPVRLALSDAGISLLPLLETTRRDGTVSFRVYRLEGP